MNSKDIDTLSLKITFLKDYKRAISMFLKLASKSLLNRKGSVLLSLLALTVSMFVLLGVEHIRHQAKDSFSNTISDVDLIVGARTGSLNLLLYSVFRIGAPTNNIQWGTYEAVKRDANIHWTIPLSLGDSHQGYRVLGTTTAYFEHFKYGNKHPLSFTSGRQFEGVYDVVLGAKVAKKLGYDIGDTLTLAHGIAKTSFVQHDNDPFTVVGILAPTGTPVDQTLHVSLEAIEAVHAAPGARMNPDHKFVPQNITAFLVGLKSKVTTFQVQRNINEYRREPLLAVLPGVVFSELWQMMSAFEDTLRLIAALVFVSALLGLSAMLLSSIRERSHEIQLLRVIGAPAWFLFMLIQLEAFLITLSSVFAAACLLVLTLVFADEFLITEFGLFLDKNILHIGNLTIIGIAFIVSIFAAFIPAISSYKQLSDR